MNSFQERKTKDLESLATRLMTDSPTSTEAWIALGYLCRAQNKVPKALYFAHKACEDDGWRPSTQAMLLKGRVLMDSKKFGEAAQHFHEALLSDRDCFELYEGLVQCQLEQNKMKEARLIARNCRDTLGLQAPRPLTLAASVLAKDPSTVGEAQVMLETAVNVAPYLLDAVYLLVDLYDKQGLYDKAISLLRQQTELHVNSKLHRLLGDFLSKTNRSIEAVDNYRHAQSLQPPDLLAASRMESLDCLPSFATPEVTAPAAAAFTTQLQMAPRRLGDGGRDTPMDDDQSF
uniref:Anaphase promoting complex subunit 7 n=1 Tax=Plectus sambesii TaxID=2011161 RepID=A0A914X9J4_9BILA